MTARSQWCKVQASQQSGTEEGKKKEGNKKPTQNHFMSRQFQQGLTNRREFRLGAVECNMKGIGLEIKAGGRKKEKGEDNIPLTIAANHQTDKSAPGC